MVNVYDYAHSLARALKESEESKAYQAALAKIKGKTTIEAMIGDFHKKQIELQAQMLQGKELTDGQKGALESLYAVIAQNPDAAAFLMAEQRLGGLVNDIMKIVGESVQMESFGLNN
ncbi:MAG TPA: YlbF family regulator [Symbiobacteriaceae bacterium]|nr:YlbF family regulator [Symbiobacteriaceae bacterium]